MNEIVLIHKILRYLFYLLVVATIVLWCGTHYQGIDDKYWMICGVCAVGCSVVRFFLRFIL